MIDRGGRARRLMLICAFGGLSAGAALAQAPERPPAQPLLLPAPTGQYGIGTYSHTVHHPTRREIFTDDPSDTRRLPVQIFYPARKGACSPSTYFPPELAAVYSDELGLRPGFERSVLGYSCPGAPIVKGKQRFPVVLFSHGLGHTRFSYFSLIEDLVSHGNIVVAVDHSYGSRATYFHDAPLVKFDNSRWGRGTDPEKYRKATEEYPRLWADDMRRVLDLIADREKSPIQRGIRGRADFDRIVYFGHSFGGMSAIYGTQHDARIKGGVNLDGFIRERFITPVASDAPFLVLNAADIDERKTYASRIRVVPIKGALHMTFSDYVWMMENFGKELPPEEVRAQHLSGIEGIAATRQILRLFLDCSLASQCGPLDARLADLRAPASAAKPAAPPAN